MLKINHLIDSRADRVVDICDLLINWHGGSIPDRALFISFFKDSVTVCFFYLKFNKINQMLQQHL